MKHKEIDPSFLLDLYAHYDNIEVRRELSHVKYISWTSIHRDWSEPDFKMNSIPVALKENFIGVFIDPQGERWVKLGVVFVDDPTAPQPNE